ncbi:MAG: formate/nitrite transporter family protein [Halanaerobium sp.]
MYRENIEKVGNAAIKKVNYMEANKLKYIIFSAFAGAFVGLGIMLIFSIGAPLNAAGSPFTKFVMGVSFAVALILVLFAGSELFTGNNLIMTVGWLDKKISTVSMLKLWFYCYLGNLIGSIFTAWMIFRSGLISTAPTSDFILSASAAKMTAPAGELFFRGVLCNILVCLAVWTAIKAKNEMAKLTLIFWCLFAFIGSGFEHSIANMTLLAMALMIPHPAVITTGGYIYNLAFVTAGNFVGGAVLIGGLYWFASSGQQQLKNKNKNAA